MGEGLEETHPIVVFGVRVHRVLDGLGSVGAWAMTAREQRESLVALARAEARIVELRLRVLAQAERTDVAAESGACSTAAWVAFHTRQGRGAAQADVVLAGALESRCALTREALAAGVLDQAQARVIVAAVAALPDSVAVAERVAAERHLVGLAGEHDARALRVLGRRVFEVIDPQAADVQEGRRLDKEEAAAQRATYLHLVDNGDGTHTGRFKVPSLHAAMLRKMLHAIAAPRRNRRHTTQTETTQTETTQAETTQAETTHPATTHLSTPAETAQAGQGPAGQDPGEVLGGSVGVGREASVLVGRPERMGAALCELLERFPVSRLPRAGGVSASVVVLLDYEKLLSGLGAVELDTGERISAGLARRLACQGGVIPAVYQRVLGGPSRVLDLGRRRRFHDSAQRIAMTIRDRGCTAQGCDRPAGWCEAHHDHTSWAEGGGTSVEKGRLLCSFHHHKAHSPHYDTTRLPNGDVAFHRRT